MSGELKSQQGLDASLALCAGAHGPPACTVQHSEWSVECQCRLQGGCAGGGYPSREGLQSQVVSGPKVPRERYPEDQRSTATP
jgi:hypothetical protein